jgi:hypothetical protein
MEFVRDSTTTMMRTQVHFEIVSDQKLAEPPQRKASITRLVEPFSPNRDVARGVWELARLHTKESWLCWYPAG